MRTIELRDGALMACGCVALAGAAAAGSYTSAALTCGLLGAIGIYYVATATARSAADGYGNSLILAGGSAVQPSLAAPDSASQ